MSRVVGFEHAPRSHATDLHSTTDTDTDATATTPTSRTAYSRAAADMDRASTPSGGTSNDPSPVPSPTAAAHAPPNSHAASVRMHRAVTATSDYIALLKAAGGANGGGAVVSGSPTGPIPASSSFNSSTRAGLRPSRSGSSSMHKEKFGSFSANGGLSAVAGGASPSGRSSSSNSPIIQPRFHLDPFDGLPPPPPPPYPHTPSSTRHAVLRMHTPSIDGLSAFDVPPPPPPEEDEEDESEVPPPPPPPPEEEEEEEEEDSPPSFEVPVTNTRARSVTVVAPTPSPPPVPQRTTLPPLKRSPPPPPPPSHFHSSIATSLHNPRVMMGHYRGASAGIPSSVSSPRNAGPVRSLDAEEIRLDLPDPSASPAPSSSRSSQDSSSGPHAVSLPSALQISNQPIAVSAASGTFTPTAWSWRQIDYADAHHTTLGEFFRALHTHSEGFVARVQAPPHMQTPQPDRKLSRASDAAAAASPSPPGTAATSPVVAPLTARRLSSSSSLLSSTLSSFTALFASSDSSSATSSAAASASPTPSPPAESTPAYMPDFVPHRLEHLTLIAQKDLLRKTKIVDGPMLGARNPTEGLLANLIAFSGTAAISESAVTARRGSGSISLTTRTPPPFPPVSPAPPSAAPSSAPLNVIPHLHTLDVRMGIHGASLGDALRRNQSLTSLILSSNVIAEAGCAAICRALHAHPALRELDLSQNILYPSSGAALRDLLLYNRTLTRLDVSINKLGVEGVATLMEALGAAKNNRTILRETLAAPAAANGPVPASATGAAGVTSPSASTPNSTASAPASFPPGSPASPPLSIVPLPAFVSAFSVNQTLTSLDLSNNRIGAEVDAVASALVCTNSQLRDLRLCLNDIGDAGAMGLALALRHPNCALHSLNLADNCIGPFGAKAIMASLEHNTSLTRIDLSWNSIGQSGLGEGPRSIGKMLAASRTLRELVLVSNAIGEAGARAIAAGWTDGLARATSELRLLDLSINPLGNDGVREIATAMTSPNSRLHTLIMHRCQVGDDGAAVLLESAAAAPQLRRLLLQGNHQLRAPACASAVAAYSTARHLIELDLDDAPAIVRDARLADEYRRARAANFAHAVWEETDLPVELGEIIAHYALDLHRKRTHVLKPGPDIL